MSNTRVTLREITEDTLRGVLQLEVTEAQKAFVAPNSISLSQALFSDKAWYRAIYADETPVGFVMLSVDTDKHEYFLWRFMIDKNHQKANYGLEAMKLVIDHVRSLPEAKEFDLSFVPGDGDPSGFYAKLGFIETGEWEEDEKIMKLKL